jgi:hypothetical protein
MSLTDVAQAMIATTLVAFFLLQLAALLVALRRSAPATEISTGARLAWTLVPLGMIVLMFGSLLITGRMSL